METKMRVAKELVRKEQEVSFWQKFHYVPSEDELLEFAETNPCQISETLAFSPWLGKSRDAEQI